MQWGASSSPRGLACFDSKTSSAGTFCLSKFANHMKCQLSFTILDLGKLSFSVDHQSNLRCINCGAKADDIDLFLRSRRRQCATHLYHEIYYTRCKLRERMLQGCCRCRSCTLAIITTFVGVDEHDETEDGNIRLPAEQEKSRLHARVSFLLASWDSDMFQRLYRRNYNIQVCC